MSDTIADLSQVVAEASTSANAMEGSSSSHNRTTLFVSRLPYAFTSTDLSTLFSDVGPLRRAFVVTDPETKVSKGVGYVTFVLRDDAERAKEQWNGKRLDVAGKARQISVEWANTRASTKVAGNETAGPTRGAQAEAKVRHAPSSRVPGTTLPPKDPDAVRTVILSGLAACQPSADTKTIYKRARKIGDVDDVVYPAPSQVDSRLSHDVALVVYRTPNHAMTAIEKLHAHVFKGAQLSAVLKKRSDGARRLHLAMRDDTKRKREAIKRRIDETLGEASEMSTTPGVAKLPKGGEVKRSSRLIIRNLPFDVRTADLRAIFLPHGPIYNIDIPQQAIRASRDDDQESATDEASHGQGEQKKALQGRGFAFVWMVSRADAAKAMDAVNGTAVGRGSAERLALKVAKGKRGREEAKLALQKATDGAQAERVVAVDWALSKTEWDKRVDVAERPGEENVGPQVDASKMDDLAGTSNADRDDVSTSTSDNDQSSEEVGDDGDGDNDDEVTKPSLPSPEEGTTLFIRNVPYQATEQELRDLFRSFGPMRYAKVTLDKATGRGRGTAFVCFWKKESADAALERARLIAKESGNDPGKPSSSAGVNKTVITQSVLTVDPSAPLASSLTLHGRVLSVAPAVDRSRASELEAQGRSTREKGDKRNTFLMREGVPLPGTELANTLAEKERERRLVNFTVRKQQLSANPSLYISKTRLSVRQLPLFATDRTLKRLAIHAVRSFDAEVRQGERADLDAAEKADDTTSAVLEGRKAQKSRERPTAVVQSKVVRQPDRLDPLTGLGRSRGYGFLEMRSFRDALKVLRWTNARKDAGQLMLAWWKKELQDMVKNVKAKLASAAIDGEKEELEARLKRLEDRAKTGDERRDKAERGGLIQMEFSIENAVITKKRKDRADVAREGAKRKKMSVDKAPEATELQRPESHAPSSLKEGRKPDSRRATWNVSTQKGGKVAELAGKKAAFRVDADLPKLGQVSGALIGRKRRERRAKHAPK